MKTEFAPAETPKSGELMSVQDSLSWAACIPTLNRIDILEINVRCLLDQHRLPKQVVIVDASDFVDQHRSVLSPLFTGTGVELIYEAASAKSSAVQRNQALSHVTADIVVYLDDDSLIFPDCAEVFLKQFEADTNNEIAGIALRIVDEFPPEASSLMPHKENQTAAIQQKKGGGVQSRSKLRELEKWKIWRFFRREILMQAANKMFIPYDHYRFRAADKPLPDAFNAEAKLRHMPGGGMALRKGVAKQEQFNPFLLAYCPFEDLDVSYRVGRHGFCLFSNDARFNHYEVEASRITRMQATSLGISNIALFIHTNSDAPLRHRFAFGIYVLRRLLGEFLKDLLTRRFYFPQARGVIKSVPNSIGIFRRPLPEAQKWYVQRQRDTLSQKKEA